MDDALSESGATQDSAPAPRPAPARCFRPRIRPRLRPGPKKCHDAGEAKRGWTTRESLDKPCCKRGDVEGLFRVGGWFCAATLASGLIAMITPASYGADLFRMGVCFSAETLALFALGLIAVMTPASHGPGRFARLKIQQREKEIARVVSAADAERALRRGGAGHG